MKINVKRLLPLLMVLMMVVAIPQAFAGDADDLGGLDDGSTGNDGSSNVGDLPTDLNDTSDDNNESDDSNNSTTDSDDNSTDNVTSDNNETSDLDSNSTDNVTSDNNETSDLDDNSTDNETSDDNNETSDLDDNSTDNETGDLDNNGTDNETSDNNETSDLDSNSTDNETGDLDNNGTDNETSDLDDNSTDNETSDDNNETSGSDDENNETTTVSMSAKQLQDVLDAVQAGSTLNLNNIVIDGVSNINITKNLTIVGGQFNGVGDSCLFVISPISEGVESVTIRGATFVLKNGDIAVKAEAINGTKPNTIDVPKINITENYFLTANDYVVPESTIILELSSQKGILAPSNEISVSKNQLSSGMIPFKFLVESVIDGSDVVINETYSDEKKASQILCDNMTTTAINYVIDGRNGEYFNFKLLDADGNPLANKAICVGFNGHVYNYTTDENGSAKTQINLAVKGGYTFAVSFLGDEEYNASFAVAKITVEQQKPSLKVQNISYKTSSTYKTFSFVFKTSRGNPVSGRLISFTVKGKTYTAKTNSKGIASVKVSLTKVGTYIISANFAGDNTYSKVTAKAKITIK